MWLPPVNLQQENFFEASLKLTTRLANESYDKEGTRRSKGLPLITESTLPLVSIGFPDAWRLQDLYPQNKIPSSYTAMLKKFDFYLVRLACSFRPQHKEIIIEHARFSLLLQPSAGSLPIAYDMHPIQITQEIKRNTKFSFGPSLKFTQLEIGTGDLDFGFEYQELIPVISASGIMESTPSWDFHEAPGHNLEGSKVMHLLLRCTKHAKPVLAHARLNAKVRAYNVLYNAVIGLEDNNPQFYRPMTIVE